MSIESKSVDTLHDETLSLLPKEQAVLYFDVLKNFLKKFKNEVANPSPSQTKETIKDKDPIQEAKDYFSRRLIFCMMLNNFNKTYTTSNLVEDRIMFREIMQSYVTLKPTESARLQEQLTPWGGTLSDLETFFHKLADYYQGYMETSIEGHPSLTETYTSVLDLYKKDKDLFDQKTFAKIMDSVANTYLLKNMSKSGFTNTLLPYDVEASEQNLIKSALDVCAQQKDDVFAKLDEYVQYKSDKETFLKKEKIWNRKKKDEAMKLFGKKEFSNYATILTNYDTLRKVYASMDTTSVEALTYQQDTQDIEKHLKDIAPILAKQKK